MSPETDSVRIARIEERLVQFHGTIKRNHDEVMGALPPIAKKAEAAHTGVIKLERDHRWMFWFVVIGVPAFTAGFTAAVEIYLRLAYAGS
jgi:hypothetical protein